MDLASTTILSLTIKADGSSKEKSIENVRAAAKFLRTGSAYLQLRNILNSYETETISTVADLQKKITTAEIEMDYQVQRASKVALIYDEAADFRVHYSDQLAARVKETYQALFGYVMQGQKVGTSFLITLGQRYKQAAVTLNLAAVMNELKERWEFHFIWAQAPSCYQTIINRLRAEQME